MNNEEKLIKCDCGEEIMVVTNCDECGIDFAIFDRQFTKYTFRNKVRLIWRIIRHGKPYTDQICLNCDKAKELARFIAKCVKNNKG